MKCKLQELYNLNILAALVVCGMFFVFFIAYSISLIHIPPEVSFLAFLVFVIFFLPINLFFKSRNKNFRLKIPSYLPQITPKILRPIALFLFMVGLIYGFSVFTEFSTFQMGKKWLIAIATAWYIVALLGIVFLPMYDSKAKRWRY